MTPTLSELYLAYRQAKTTLYFERRGVGLLELAAFEEKLPENLSLLRSKLSGAEWFDAVALGDIWVVPKRLYQTNDGADDVIRIGSKPIRENGQPIEVQLRLSPHPEFATLEVFYLWRFGSQIDSMLSSDVLGYRLDLKQGQVVPHRRWLFEYWPTRYQQFRKEPLNAARRALRDGASVLIISGDLASFYDSVNPSFLLTDDFLSLLMKTTSEFDLDSYREASASLLRAYSLYRKEATRRAGVSIEVGVPIGALTSRLIANIALAPLDAYVAKQPGVLCYRRYVDDIVVVAKSEEKKLQLVEVLRKFLPMSPPFEDVLRLDVDKLGRPGSQFQIQKTKMRVHQLEGVAGRDFVDAVATDFGKLVSERRAFIDTDVLVQDGASHLVRAGKSEGSPLRVLRDADRARLERFALSTSLHSLERVSSLVDPEHAREVVRRSLERIGRVLDAEDNWVDNLEVALRFLKLAISTGDWKSCVELNDQMERVWGTVDTLRESTLSIYYRGELIDSKRTRPWVWLRNYLHARRLESVCSSLPMDAKVSSLREWLGDGLRVRTELVGTVALLRRAKLLAASDLRSRDREDDERGTANAANMVDFRWMYEPLSENADLRKRFDTIQIFVDQCIKLSDSPWALPPARLFLSTRPPSYFDIARRWLYRAETGGFAADVFDRLLDIVNAVRGTNYRDSVGSVLDPHTVAISPFWELKAVEPAPDSGDGPVAQLDPRVIIGNLVVKDNWWTRAATRVPGAVFGTPALSLRRLIGVNNVLVHAARAARGKAGAVLVLPELSLPRQWFRAIASHVVRFGGHGLVAGLEYLHDVAQPYVRNQTYAVFPGHFGSVATWPWTKRLPAREEASFLASLPMPVTFPPPPASLPSRIVVMSPWGTFSVLICSELIEARRIADLLGRVELVLCPAWNRDTSSYDHLIQSAGFQLHAIIAIANNGHYSDCRSWAPREVRWERDLCRLIERDVDDVVYVDIPLTSLAAFHAARGSGIGSGWRPLPPDWP